METGIASVERPSKSPLRHVIVCVEAIGCMAPTRAGLVMRDGHACTLPESGAGATGCLPKSSLC